MGVEMSNVLYVQNLQQQLAAALSACKQKDDALLACKQMEVEDLRQQVTLLRDELNTVYKLVPDLVPVMHPSALATTDDLSGYILCEKEPVAWENSELYPEIVDHQRRTTDEPLYRAATAPKEE